MNGKIRSLIAAALLMFVIAGCGGNGGDGGGGATLSSIAVTPANPSIKVGATQQFAATGTYSDGSTQDITASATWSSSDETKATINASPDWQRLLQQVQAPSQQHQEVSPETLR